MPKPHEELIALLLNPATTLAAIQAKVADIPAEDKAKAAAALNSMPSGLDNLLGRKKTTAEDIAAAIIARPDAVGVIEAVRGVLGTIPTSPFIKKCLYNAAEKNSVLVVENLLDAYPALPVKAGDKALRLAAMYGSHEVIDVLTTQRPDILTYKPESTTSFYSSPLHMALRCREEDAALQLIDKGLGLDYYEEFVNVDIPRRLTTSLTTAAKNNCVRVVGALLDKGVHPYGIFESPLSGAAGAGHEAVVDLLLAREVRVDKSGDPLYGAALGGHRGIIKKLLAKTTFGRYPWDKDWVYSNAHKLRDGGIIRAELEYRESLMPLIKATSAVIDRIPELRDRLAAQDGGVEAAIVAQLHQQDVRVVDKKFITSCVDHYTGRAGDGETALQKALKESVRKTTQLPPNKLRIECASETMRDLVAIAHPCTVKGAKTAYNWGALDTARAIEITFPKERGPDGIARYESNLLYKLGLRDRDSVPVGDMTMTASPLFQTAAATLRESGVRQSDPVVAAPAPPPSPPPPRHVSASRVAFAPTSVRPPSPERR